MNGAARGKRMTNTATADRPAAAPDRGEQRTGHLRNTARRQLIRIAEHLKAACDLQDGRLRAFEPAALRNAFDLAASALDGPAVEKLAGDAEALPIDRRIDAGGGAILAVGGVMRLRRTPLGEHALDIWKTGAAGTADWHFVTGVADAKVDATVEWVESFKPESENPPGERP